MKYINATNVDKMPWVKANWMHNELLDDLEERNKQLESINDGSY